MESKNGRFDATNGDLEIDVKTVDALQASKDPVCPPILVLVGMRGPLQESFIQEYIASKGNRIKAICTVECSSTIEGMERFDLIQGTVSLRSSRIALFLFSRRRLPR